MYPLSLVLFAACSSSDTEDETDTVAGDTDVDTDTDSDTDTDTDSDTGDTTGDTGVLGHTGHTGEVELPLPVGLWWLDDVRPVDVTPDGRTFLVQDLTTLAGELRFVDTATLGQRFAANLGDASRDLAGGLSADLDIAALHGVPIQAGVWSVAGGWTDLASPFPTGCDADFGGAWDVSDDGSVVVGLMWDGCAPLGFRWSAATGVQVLDTLGSALPGSPSHATNRASVVSGDGAVIAGFASNGVLDRTPARWLADGSGLLLLPGFQLAPGEVLSIDGDGSTLAGNVGGNGFLWTEAGGFLDLGRPPGALPADPVYPNAMTADGAGVFGGVGNDFFSVPVAFVWTSTDGSRTLQPLVEAAGVVVGAGYLLTNVLAVSDDGSVVVGLGYDPSFLPKAFVLSLPPSAYGL